MPLSSPPRIDLKPAPSCDPMFLDRTVSPITSPSTSVTSCPARSFVVETSILCSFRSSGPLEVLLRRERLWMILPEEDAATLEDVLVQPTRLLVLAAQVQRRRETRHRTEGRGIVLAEQAPPRLDHLLVELASSREVAPGREYAGKPALRRERLRRILPERSTPRLDHLVLERSCAVDLALREAGRREPCLNVDGGRVLGAVHPPVNRERRLLERP